MSIQLIPCPECGNAHPTIFEYNRGYSSTFHVCCFKCGHIGLPADNEATAIELWNRGDDGLTLAEPRKEAGRE